MSHAAALTPIHPRRVEADAFSPRMRRGLRRIRWGIRLVGRGLGDVAVAMLEPPARAWRGLTSLARALRAALARIVATLAQPPATLLALWGTWAWRVTRPVLPLLVWTTTRLAPLAAFSVAVALLTLWLTPLLGVVLDGVHTLADRLGERLSDLVAHLPSSDDLARAPWGEWAAVLERLMWAALTVLLAGAAVALLAFGLWLLALSAYVAGRTTVAAGAVAVRGARRAGLAVGQALGFVAYLLAKVVAQNAAALAVLALVAGAAILGVLFATGVIAPLAGLTPEGVTGGVVDERALLVVAAALTALVMLLGLFTARRAVVSVLAALLVLAAAAGLAWIISRPVVTTSIASFVDACQALLERGSRAVAERIPQRDQAAAQAPAPVDAAPAEAAPTVAAAVPAADPPPPPAPEPETPAPEPAAPAPEPPAVEVVYPVREASWAWGSDARLVERAADGEATRALFSGELDREAICGSGTVVAIGAASSDGGRAHNEALAYRRGLRLGRLVGDATRRCDAARRPAVWVLGLGQSTVLPPAPAQRAPVVVTLDAPDAPLDAEGRLAVGLPLDPALYSEYRLCRLSPVAGDDETLGAAVCAEPATLP